MKAIKWIIWSMLFLASTAMVAQSNKKWLDSIYRVHELSLQRGDSFVTKENDTVQLLRPKTNNIWKIRKAGKTKLIAREAIFELKRIRKFNK